MNWSALIWNHTKSRDTSRKQPGKRPPVRKRQTVLALETLESRLVLSAAVAANDFLNSLGINIHISQGVSEATYESLFNYTGIRNARDLGTSGLATAYVALHNQTGVLFDIFADNSGNVGDLLSTGHSLANAGGLLSFEGPNEPNNFPITYKGHTGGGTAGTWRPVARYQRAIYSQVKGDSTLGNYPVFGVSEDGAENDNVGLQFLAIPTGAGTLMPDGTQYADCANPHDYLIPFDGSSFADNEAWGASDPLVTGPWDGLYREYGVTWKHHFAGYSNAQLATLPRVTTETGWQTGDGTNRTISEDQQGKLYLNTYLDFYKQGWTHTFIYQMRDNEGGPSNTWGIYHADSTPKMAATDLHNLTTILADHPSHARGRLKYSIPNEPATVHNLLLQKSDGTFYLAVWDERVVGTGSDQVTVDFGRTQSVVKVYDPTIDTTVQQQLANVNSVSLSLSDHPLILAIPGRTGFSAIGTALGGNTLGVVKDMHVTATAAIDPSTFPLSQVARFTHTGSSGMTGPNGHFVEAVDSDVDKLAFGVRGLRVLNRTVRNRGGFPDELRVTFNEPVDTRLLAPDRALLTGPDESSDDVMAVLPMAGFACAGARPGL